MTAAPVLPWRIFAAGLAAWASLGAVQAFLWVAEPDQARAMLLHLGAELGGGREAGVPVGLAAGAHPMLVWFTSFAQDLGTALTTFPLFLWMLHHYHDRDIYLMRRIRKIERGAARHQGYVKRWGPLGLGVFIVLPYLVNGPFISLVVGRLGGIPVRRMLPWIVAGTAAAAALWTLLFRRLQQLAEKLHPDAGYWLAGLAVAAVVVAAIVDYLRERRDRRAMHLVDSEEE